MIKLFTTSALAASALAGTAQAASPSSSVEAMLGDIMANPADAAAFDGRCSAYVTEIQRRQAELEAETGPATIDGTLRRFDDLSNLIGAASGEATLHREVMTDEARRTAGATCEVKIAAEANKLSLSRPIYDRFKAIPTNGVDAVTQRYIKDTLGDFERAGVALPPKQRARV